MVPSNRALVNSYRLSVVTMPLTEAVWLQFAIQVFGMQTVPPFRRNRGSCRGSELVPHLQPSHNHNCLNYNFSL